MAAIVRPLSHRIALPRPALSLAAVLLCLGVFAVAVRPHIVTGEVPGDAPDALDYAYGAAALLHGSYTVQWIGPPSIGSADSNGVAHIPRYPPGYSLLLLPAVALGGVAAAVWVNYACALLLGAIIAWLAARLWDIRAAPAAVALCLCSVGMVTYAHTVMSDLPTTTLVLLELAILVGGRSHKTALLAGLLAGGLVWIRIPNLFLLGAGLAALSALPEARRRAVLYVAGALPLLVLLGLWQNVTYGSPWTTGYAVLHTGPTAHSGISSLFRMQYMVGQPFGRSGLSWRFHWPNALLYLLTFLGFKFWSALPGACAAGLGCAILSMRRTGARGAVSRFTIVALIATLAVYLPYYWQAVRFLLVPATLLNLMAGVAMTQWLAPRVSRWAHGLFGTPRSTDAASDSG